MYPKRYVSTQHALFVMVIRTSTLSYENRGHVNIIVNMLQQPTCNNKECNHKRANRFYRMIVSAEIRSRYSVRSVNGKVIACRQKQCDESVCGLEDSDHLLLSVTDLVTNPNHYGTYYVNCHF